MSDEIEVEECGHPLQCVVHEQGPEDADEVCLWCAQLAAAGEVAEYEKGLLRARLTSALALIAVKDAAMDQTRKEIYTCAAMARDAKAEDLKQKLLAMACLQGGLSLALAAKMKSEGK